MRSPAQTDFQVEVPGLGSFTYGRRTYGDRVKIRQKYLQLLGRPDDETADEDLVAMCAIIAAHDVLCVKAPPGWEDLAEVDLITSPENEAMVLLLYAELKTKEDSFRRSAQAPGAG